MKLLSRGTVIFLLSLAAVFPRGSAYNIFDHDHDSDDRISGVGTTNTSSSEYLHLDSSDETEIEPPALFIEGDIAAEWDSIASLYGPEVAESMGLTRPLDAQEQTRGTVPTLRLWRNNWWAKTETFVLPVYISTAYSSAQVAIIKKSLRNLQRKTGVIKFQFLSSIPSGSATIPYIHIYDGGGCWSYIGRIAAANLGQYLSLTSMCVNDFANGPTQHEILHALGFYHEHSRPDRDQYVDILYGNISPGAQHNFAIATNVNSLGTKYDYNSVMHYSEYDFSGNGQKTISARGKIIGQRKAVSWLDVQQVRLMYQCESGPRTLSQHQQAKCSSDCKCGKNQMGCGSDSNVCKGNLRCVSNKCTK